MSSYAAALAALEKPQVRRAGPALHSGCPAGTVAALRSCHGACRRAELKLCTSPPHALDVDRRILPEA